MTKKKSRSKILVNFAWYLSQISSIPPSLKKLEIFDVDVYVYVYVHMMYRERERSKKLHRPGLGFPAHY